MNFSPDKNPEDLDFHLYGIFDKQEDDDVFKYGISSEELNKNGTSSRANKQVNFLNRAVGWIRYHAKILVKKIKGLSEAERLEQEYIDNYEKKNGKKPKGNQ